MIVTVEPLLTVTPAFGVCPMTTPSWLCFLTFWVCCTTLKPAAVSVAAAFTGVCPFTSGTFAVVGALAITSVIVLLVGTCEFGGGSWLMTLPSGTVEDVWLVVFTLVKPAE